VYDRVKSPYPSTQDPEYAVALQEHAKDLLVRPSHPVFELVDRERLRRAAHRDAPHVTQASRRGLERALDLALWLDLYGPEVSLT
jgi:asparagine synthase (glutamine-hydrolysing)